MMKFNWRANWEIMLVLVIIVAGIVITTIAAIRNKDKPLLPLVEDTDFGHSMSGVSSNEHSGSLIGIHSSVENDEVLLRPPSQVLRGLRNQSPFHRPQVHGLSIKNNPINATSEATRFDDTSDKQVTLDQSNASQEDQYDSSTNDQTPSQQQTEVLASIKTNLNRLQQASRVNLRLNKSQPLPEDNSDAVYTDNMSESVDLLDDIHTTRSSMSLPGQDPYNLQQLHHSQQPRSQHDQRHVLQQNQFMTHSHPNQEQTLSSIQPFNPTTSSLNHHLNQLLVHQQANANHRLEAPTFDLDDMLTSYSRPPVTGTQPREILINSSHIINPALLSNLIAADSGSNDALYGQHQVVQKMSPQPIQQQPSSVPLQHHRRFAATLPISMLLGDFLKLARPNQAQAQAQKHLNYSSHGANQPDSSHKPQNSFLHQLRGLPGPLMSLLQGLSPSAHGNDHHHTHDASESSQYYHRISVPMDTMAQSMITQSQSLSPVLPAFPAPKGITHSWIPATSGGTYHPSQNSNAEFVANNAAGFVRANQQILTKTGEEATPLGSQHHESFTIPGTDSGQVYQQQHQHQQQQHSVDMNGVAQHYSQPQVQHHQHHQQPHQHHSNQPQRINEFFNSIPENEPTKLQSPVHSYQKLSGQSTQSQRQTQQLPMFNRNNILPQGGGSQAGSTAELVNLLNFQSQPQSNEHMQSFGLQTLLNNPSASGGQFAPLLPNNSPLLFGGYGGSQSSVQTPVNHRPYETFGGSQVVGSESAPKITIATADQTSSKVQPKNRKKRSYKSNEHISNYDEDEEDTDLDKPMSVVRLDGQPTNSGRVRSYTADQDSDSQDSQASHSLRETNHDYMKQPQYKEMAHSKRENSFVARNNIPRFETASSGLMNKLLGTASNREESDEELDDDDEAGNERRREELEDTDAGVVNEPRETLRAPPKATSNLESGLTHSRRDQRPDIEFYGHPGEETRTLKYGILGSGNYEVVNGGVYSESDESTAAVNSVANYVRKPNLLASKMLAEQQANAFRMGYLPGMRLSAGVDAYLRDASANPGGDILLAPLGHKHVPNPLLELIDASGIQMFDAGPYGPLGIEGSERSVLATQQDPPEDPQARDNQVSTEFGERPMRKPENNKDSEEDKQAGMMMKASLLDEQVGPTSSSHRHSGTKAGRLRPGNDQFNSYQILPSKKVTIFSDKDLDSAPNEMYSHKLRQIQVT